MATFDITTARQPLTYRVILRSVQFIVREIVGEEALGRPFRFEARFVTQEGELLNPSDFISQTASVFIERDGLVSRHLHGIVTEASLAGTVRGAPELHVVIEPRLALLRYQSDARVFRDETVPEIVTDVLREMQIGCELRLRETYARRPYCVQMRETTLDFVHRLLEDEGIFYTFPDHLTDEPKTGMEEHAIILGDATGAYAPIDGDAHLAFRAASQMLREAESITAISKKARLAPGKVTLGDWNLEKPSLPMQVSAQVPGASKATYYDYPGKYEVPAEGERKARLMSEALACEASTVTGSGDVARLACGRTFHLVESPAAFDGELVIVKLAHEWRIVSGTADSHSAPAKHEVRFTALPATITYRPPRVTPEPKINAPLTGFVTGPEGEDIHTDEFGRVKVHFPWDRHQAKDDHCSHWIPVLQDNTGHSSAIPRVGWEVVVSHVEGDPDRPFVLGRVYNALDRFPEALPEGKTKSALRSLSSPGRDGQNQIWIDDKAGEELVAIQAEKDQNVKVANDKKEDVLNTEANTVVLDETIIIGGNNTVTVGAAQSMVVDGNQSIEVKGSRSRKVGTTEQVAVNGNRDVKIGGSHTRMIGGFDIVGAKSMKETIGAVDLEVSLKANKTAAAMVDTLTVGGAVLEVAGEGKVEDTQMLRVETVGMMVYTGVKAAFGLDVGTKRSTFVGARLFVSALSIGLQAVAKTFTATIDGEAKFTGTELKLKAGGSEVNFTADGIFMKSDGDIVIAASGASALAAASAKLDK